MSGWSGLGPAYQAHVVRAAKVRKDVEAMESGQPTVNVSPSTALGPLVQFVKSWGLPKSDGSIAQSGAVTDESTVSGPENLGPTTDHHARLAANLLRKEHTMLSTGETLYVSSHVVHVVTHAALSAEPEPLFPTDLPSRSGFAVLETPVLLPDLHPYTGELRHDLEMPVRAFGWTQMDSILHGPADDRREGSGILVWLYTTPDDYLRWFKPSAERVTGEKSALHEPGSLLGGAVARDGMIIIDILPWAFGVPWGEREVPEHQAMTVPGNVSVMRRWLMALLRFTWQRLVTTERQSITSKQQRRALPFRPSIVPEVSVLRLRRYMPNNHQRGHGDGESLSMTVLVRGHWRRQWFRSLGPARTEDGQWNPESHRLVWIEPHLRGDGPLGPVRKASVVVR
jgi:hypothetical protein